MRIRAGLWVTMVAVFPISGVVEPAGAQQVPAAVEPYRPTEAERAEILDRTADLAGRLAALRGRLGEGPGARDALDDVEVCLKAASWVVRLDEFREPRDVARTLKVIARGIERAGSLDRKRAPWAEAAGGVVRGYRSKVDGSVQPYAVIVPAGPGPDDRQRLDVVLHGRDAKLSEVRFFDAHDGKPAPPGLPGLVLHVFGRGNNAYRWAGEADVLEAIDAVKRNYRVDDRRVVLRGFSMGGAGAWHLGLHDPSRWASVEAGAGFSETIEYAKLVDPSDVVRKGLHIYDAVDYAVNASNVPIVGYGGEDDPQIQASKNIEAALVALGVPMDSDGLVTRARGIDFLRIVGKGMGHAVDKPSQALMTDFHDRHAQKGTDLTLAKIRFATYTLKYNKVGWLTIKRLIRHYERATIDAEIKGDLATVRTANIAALAVSRQAGETLQLDGQEFPLREAAKGLLPDVYFRKGPQGWELLDHDGSLTLEEDPRGEKHPGLQGPIDDAFTGAFLCVRATGRPNHPKVQAWAEAPPRPVRPRLVQVIPGRPADQERRRRHRPGHRGKPPDPLRRPRLEPPDRPGLAGLAPGLVGVRDPARRRLPRRRPRAGVDPGQPAEQAPLRRPQRRPHLRRQGPGRDQRPTLPPPGGLCRPQDWRAGRGEGGRLFRREVEEAMIDHD